METNIFIPCNLKIDREGRPSHKEIRDTYFRFDPEVNKATSVSIPLDEGFFISDGSDWYWESSVNDSFRTGIQYVVHYLLMAPESPESASLFVENFSVDFELDKPVDGDCVNYTVTTDDEEAAGAYSWSDVWGLVVEMGDEFWTKNQLEVDKETYPDEEEE